jgi:hypothetical protein
MIRAGLAAMWLTALAPAVSAEERLIFSVTGAGQPGPEKLCEIGFDANGFWAIEQIATNSFPAPRVPLESVETRGQQFADVLAMLDGGAPNVPAWRDAPPDAPYLTLVHAKGEGETATRREAYMPGLGVPPQVAFLFGDIHRYGMDCLPPVLR